jgi:pimeloyl-ACP methyl ester carboxylesterase
MRLSGLEPAEPVRRQERDHPGEILPIDIKKLGKFSRVGHRISGDRTGQSNTRGVGWEYRRLTIDDPSRLAYPNVKALVYVHAFAPDEGESPLSLLASYPPPLKDFFTAVPFAAGGDADVYLAQKYCGPVFASDVPPAMASVMAAAQRPITGSALNEKAPSAEGWKTIPSWYVVGDADNVIPPPLQMMMAQRAKAHITHVKGSHPSMIQHPEATVAAILAAAAATQTSAAAK